MTQAQALQQHPQRLLLHNEVHARPPEALQAPQAISHVVMACDAAEREASRAHLALLASDHHLPSPDAASTHVRLDLGMYRLRWELHTEFVSWTFSRLSIAPGENYGDPYGPTDFTTQVSGAAHAVVTQAAIAVVPKEWLARLPGKCLSALNLWLLPHPGSDAEPAQHARAASTPQQAAPQTAARMADSPNQTLDASPAQRWIRQMLVEDALVASSVAGGWAEVYTDFSVHADGFSRMLLLVDPRVTSRRLGRLVQSLLEIETYRMAALLGLPAAREASAVLGSAEAELAELAQAIRSATRNDEPALLDRLTRLAGQVEGQHALTHSRFSASAAYFELVDKRIDDIDETRLPGLQTIREFMDRRLTPARSTCAWSSRRQDALSQRVSRISNLLRTRVEIEQQQSSQALLATMNNRQGLQLRLQSTVEGLSVAAITYYIVGLVSYLAKGAQALGWPLAPETTAALAIPVVAVAVWWSLRSLHRKVFADT